MAGAQVINDTEEKRIIDLKTGYACNNNCLFCVVGHLRGRNLELTTQDIKEALDKSREEYNMVTLTGGEVSIRKDFFEIIKHANELDYHIVIQTNGRAFSYKSFCEETIEASGGKIRFLISPHSSKEDLHNTLTQTDSWRQTIQSIVLLTEMGQSVRTNSVVTKMNYEDLPDLARMLISLNVDSISFAFVKAMGNAEKNIELILPRKTEVSPWMKEAIRICVDRGKPVTVEAFPPCFLRGGYESCTSERFTRPVKIHSKNRIIEDYRLVRENEEMSKGPHCGKCLYDKLCEGPRRQYPERYGWDEFIPIE